MSAAPVVVPHKQNGRAIALPFRFLVGTQKLARVKTKPLRGCIASLDSRARSAW